MRERTEAQREAERRYNQSEKGKARYARYEQTAKGKARHSRWQIAKYSDDHEWRIKRRLRQDSRDRANRLAAREAPTVKELLDGASK